MSQYAFYLATKERMPNTKYVTWSNDHNGYELGQLFGIPSNPSKIINFIFRLLFTRRTDCPVRLCHAFLRALKISLHTEGLNYAFDPSNTRPKDNNLTIWSGGWHNYRYFENISNKLHEIFRFPIERLNQYSRQILSEIKSSQSVALHIRRGDYCIGDYFKLYGCVCSLDYYRNAIAIVRERVDNPRFFIFSNDIEWVRAHLEIPEAKFVDGNKRADSWMDMYLISQCQNIVIANSTFSWWGAYLSNASLIICPDRFINDDHSGEIYPLSWTRVSS